MAHVDKRGGRSEGEDVYWLCLVKKLMIAASYSSVPSLYCVLPLVSSLLPVPMSGNIPPTSPVAASRRIQN